MSRWLKQGGTFVSLGGVGVTGVTVVDELPAEPDAGTVYLVAADAEPGDLVTFRVNGKLGSGLWVGGIELWVPPVLAVGGSETDITVDGTPHRVHTITSSGDFEVFVDDLACEWLVVGPGGNGGASSIPFQGGGGGAGGDVHSGNEDLSFGVYACTVTSATTVFASVQTAAIGGKGSDAASNQSGVGGANTGHSGGSASSGTNVGGGGGAGAGSGGNASSGPGGGGATGTTSNITGSAIVYGSGGGGGGTLGGGGGAGGPGAGSGGAGAGSGGNATANSGGGGGGGGATSNATTRTVGNGAAGIVIVRYPLA